MHVLGIMGSGFPGKLDAIYSAIKAGTLTNTRIGAVVSNKPAVPLVEMALGMGIPTLVIDNRKTSEIDRMAKAFFYRHNVELVLLAGYKRKVGHMLLDAFPDMILNIHPGPIPQFGGKGMGGILVQRAVLDAGVEYTGPVVHIVDEEYDHGRVLDYYPIKVNPNDTAETLHERCLMAGNLLYVRVIKDFLYRLDNPPTL